MILHLVILENKINNIYNWMIIYTNNNHIILLNILLFNLEENNYFI